MVSHEEVRKERISEIKQNLERAIDKGTLPSKEKLVAKYCIKWGASRRKVLEYIKIIELASDYNFRWSK